MGRRGFLQLAAAAGLYAEPAAPHYKIVSTHNGTSPPGMPGRYPGRVVRVKSENSVDVNTEHVNAPVVGEMITRGMCSLTGARTGRDAWAQFFTPKDVVGIKVNCSGAPNIMSSPEIVSAIVANLNAIGVPARNITIYERFLGQLQSVHYERVVPAEVTIAAAEQSRGALVGYDPHTYVEVNFFGEDDTRSNLTRMVVERFTKIINVPNMKDHGASGVTGCLKNIAYGNFSNVARSHNSGHTNTLTFIGTLAAVEPLRSKTVLQILDGLRGVWHGGPFSPDRRFRFYPKQMMFGTDPVAIDRIERDVIDAKRKAQGALSIFDRDERNLDRACNGDPHRNCFVREPHHIEYAGKLGLGVAGIANIKLTEIAL